MENNVIELARAEEQFRSHLAQLEAVKTEALRLFGHFLARWYRASVRSYLTAEPQVALAFNDVRLLELKRDTNSLIEEAAIHTIEALDRPAFWWHLERPQAAHRAPGFLYCFWRHQGVGGFYQTEPHLLKAGFADAFEKVDFLMGKYGFGATGFRARRPGSDEYPPLFEECLQRYGRLVDAAAAIERNIASLKLRTAGDEALRRFDALG